ncbi:uncharacterized protein LOC120419495 [Culex pipiens pallens]|uniref:uncharacterized protein LOC120419495 n=1 Tax=Culex pipiens pallens TaxID=42434 RepID=UPI001954E93D|nr:uncharacterized protein LOC120419495 [Culex pipiens pallens]
MASSSSSTNVAKAVHPHSTFQRSPFTKAKSQSSRLNVAAAPFVSSTLGQKATGGMRSGKSMPEIGYIGELPVNSRIWSSISSHPLEQKVAVRSTTPSELFQYYQQQQQHHHQLQQQQLIPSIPRHLTCDSLAVTPVQQFGPVAMPNGIIQLRLRDGVVIEMTIDKSLKLINSQEHVTIALSHNGTLSALKHPNGIVFQNGPKVDIVAYDGRRNNSYIRYAKMWQKGISLTSEGCALIYLVDAAGTRTTSDMINIDLNTDYISPVFFNGARVGAQFCAEAETIAQGANFWLNDDGTEQFQLNGYRIQQTVDGLVKVARMNNRCNIRTSPTNGSATITTPNIHCTASMGQTSHLFVRREERRMHFDGTSIVVRNAGHSAGFDEWNRLRVY